MTRMLTVLLAGLTLLLVEARAAVAADRPIRYVLLGVDGAPIARVITTDTACPVLHTDGKALAMTVRAPAQTLAQRPNQAKVSAYPVTVCEAAIPVGAHHASVLGRRLPLPPARVDRILVIGDTGCRVKAADNAYQACNDAKAYPFATVAKLGAAWKPELVVHVGDYEYRESACPDTSPGCKGSPWGYGWDAWKADFFTPGAPLLAAAPLVLARGNHENCARAGQGWYRMLDVRPLVAGHDCNDAANDSDGDFNAPYAVPLGGGEQIVVMDLAIAGNQPLTPTDPRAAQFRSAWSDLKALSARASSTFMLTHKPILGFAAVANGGKTTLFGGNPALQSVFAAEDPNLFPAGVDVLLAGHVHVWEQLDFSTPHPTQFVAGFSGTQEDTVPMPAFLPPGATPAPGAVVDAFSSWVDGFGYMTLERDGPRKWRVKVWNLDGALVNRCVIEGRHSRCEKPQIHSS